MELWFILLLFVGLSLIGFICYKIQFNRKINIILEKTIQQSSKGSKYIPKNIYQLIADKNNIHPEFKKNIEYIKKTNPEWKHILYDDNDILIYIKNNYPQYILDTYNRININYGAARADFFRYLLLYKEGGVYLDIKSSMSYPLNHVIKENDEFILAHWPCVCHKNLLSNKFGEFQQWHIICKPHHPYLKAVIDNVVKNINNYDLDTYGTGKLAVLKITGPIAYTESIKPILQNHNHVIYEMNEHIGLIYNNIKNYKNNFNKKHYSQLTEPVIL